MNLFSSFNKNEVVEDEDNVKYCPCCRNAIRPKSDEFHHIGHYICNICNIEWDIDGWDITNEKEEYHNAT